MKVEVDSDDIVKMQGVMDDLRCKVRVLTEAAQEAADFIDAKGPYTQGAADVVTGLRVACSTQQDPLTIPCPPAPGVCQECAGEGKHLARDANHIAILDENGNSYMVPCQCRNESAT